MSRFNSVLENKRLDELKKKEKEDALRDLNSITKEVSVKPKTLKEYVVSVIKSIVYLCFIVVVFIGLLTLLNPISREVLGEFLQSTPIGNFL